jgi:hypothetical protein
MQSTLKRRAMRKPVARPPYRRSGPTKTEDVSIFDIADYLGNETERLQYLRIMAEDDPDGAMAGAIVDVERSRRMKHPRHKGA